MPGDTFDARIVYEDFLTLWKDADPTVPTLSSAQRSHTPNAEAYAERTAA
jgi:hypothetical protein